MNSFRLLGVLAACTLCMACQGRFNKDINNLCKSPTQFNLTNIEESQEEKVMQQYITYTLIQTKEGQEILTRTSHKPSPKDLVAELQRAIKTEEIKTCPLVNLMETTDSFSPRNYQGQRSGYQSIQELKDAKAKLKRGERNSADSAVQKISNNINHCVRQFSKQGKVKTSKTQPFTVYFSIEQNGRTSTISILNEQTSINTYMMACLFYSMQKIHFTGLESRGVYKRTLGYKKKK